MDDVLLEVLTLFAPGPQYVPGVDLPFWTNAGTPPELKVALQNLTEQIEANPHDAEAWVKRGAVCQGLDRYAEAYADLTQALRLNPNHARAWLLLSEVLRCLRMHEQAKSSRLRALELDPQVEGPGKNPS